MSSMMDSPEKEPSTRSLISLVLVVLAISSVTCSAKMAHRRIDEREGWATRAQQRIDDLHLRVLDIEKKRR